MDKFVDSYGYGIQVGVNMFVILCRDNLDCLVQM